MSELISIEKTRQLLDILSEKLDRWIEHPEQIRYIKFNVQAGDMFDMTTVKDTAKKFAFLSNTYEIKICAMENL